MTTEPPRPCSITTSIPGVPTTWCRLTALESTRIKIPGSCSTRLTFQKPRGSHLLPCLTQLLSLRTLFLHSITVAILCSRIGAASQVKATVSALSLDSAQNKVNLEFLLIDNGASLSAMERPGLRIIPGPGDEPRSRNLAIRESTSDWLLFIDDDVTPAPGMLGAYQRALAADPLRSAYYGPTILEKPQFPSAALRAARAAAPSSAFELPLDQEELEWSPTSNALFSRQRLIQVGGFRTPVTARVGACDVDMGIRLTKVFGLLGKAVPSASCIHSAQSWSRLRPNLLRFFTYGLGEASLVLWHPQRTTARHVSWGNTRDIPSKCILAAYRLSNDLGFTIGRRAARLLTGPKQRFDFRPTALNGPMARNG